MRPVFSKVSYVVAPLILFGLLCANFYDKSSTQLTERIETEVISAPDFCNTTNNPIPNHTDQGNWLQKVQQDIALREYHINYAADKKYHQSPNRANNTRITYYPNSISIAPRSLEEYEETSPTEPNAERKLSKTFEDYTLHLEVKGYGTSDKLVHSFQAEQLRSENNEAYAQDEHMQVEYINNEEGTRQNFIITQPIKGNELAVHLNISTSLTATQENNGSIKFTGKQNSTQLYYNDLKVWDATGKELPAQMMLSSAHASSETSCNTYTLLLAVNTTGVTYPITVDPIVTNGTPANANTTLECNVVDANLGWAASSAGDVNGDGYSDVIVGAYSYDNDQNGEGAAYVYYGTATGINTTAAWMVEGNQTDASCGSSAALAGDVNGDGYSDIIVGTVSHTNGETEEGKVEVYYGSASGLSPTPSWSAQSNVAGARMGYSATTAGDVNGDGYSDVVVGAPYYNNGQTNEGSIYVYHGSSSGLANSPAAIIQSNSTNAYYGWCVSSAGDVNGDSFSDIIVGAYGYTNGQSNEGAAFVYLGSASGINTTHNVMLELDQATAYAGFAVSSAGDVNGDGYADVVVGAIYYDNGQTNEGVALLYYGGSTGINSTAAWRYESNQNYTNTGRAVASAGDVNGDGYGDIIVGVSEYNNGQSIEGIACVFMGSASGLTAGPSSIIESNQADAYLGAAVSCAGDVNGDGYSDVIIGAPMYDNGQTNEGNAFVYHGSASGISTTASAMRESNQASAYFGISISSAGDVNADGYSDVIVGSFNYDNGQSNEGAAFVYHGSASGISTTAAAMVESNQAGAYMGWSVSSLGDVNGDGYSDVIVGAFLYDNGLTDEGAAFVYHGSASGISTTAAAMVESNQASAFMGCSVSSAGDVNGDGYSDVIVGAYYYDNGESNEGAAFVYHGSASGISTTAAAMVESNQASAYMGYSVSSAGDVNGDGYSDVIFGATYYDNGQTNEGAAFVYHGSANGISTTAAAMVESNQAADAQMGYSVSSAGDVNGDGYSDVIVGSNFYDNGQTDEGAAFVYHGSASGISTTAAAVVESNQANAEMGISVAGAGDVNGDGYSDVIVCANYYDNGQTDEGAAFVYHGSASGISTTAAAMVESNQASALMGRSMSSAGDVNGDGYSDVVVGADRYDNGQIDEGAAFIYYGNGGSTGKHNNVRLYNTDLSTPIQQSNKSNSSFGLGLYTSSPEGRQKVKMVWEVKTQGQPFSSAGGNITNSVSNTSVQSSYSNTGLTGTNLNNLVTKPGFQTKVRCRVQYDLVTSITGQKYGPWRYPQGYLNGQQGMSSTPLPVEWLNFTAQWLQEGESAQLNWSTASEKNNSHFTILRSTDGQNWEEVTQVNGAGTTTNISQYTYIDQSLKHLNTSTHLYYRLMQTDYNGQFSFSDIRELTLTLQAGISVAPNPGATQVITLQQVTQVDLPYTIVDMQGKEVSSGIILKGNAQQVINLQHLPAGVYLLSMEQGGKKESIKLIRQ